MFGSPLGEYDKNNLEFVYVEFEPYVPVANNDGKVWNPNFLGTFRWGAKGKGFGEVAVFKMDDEDSDIQFYFDTERENKNFLKQMFNYIVEHSVTDVENPNNVKPDFMRQYKEV